VFGYNGYNIEFARRKFETNTIFFRTLLPKLRIPAEFGVPVRYGLIRVSEPESNEIFWSTILAKPRGTESAEGVKTCLRMLHGFENRVQAAVVRNNSVRPYFISPSDGPSAIV